MKRIALFASISIACFAVAMGITWPQDISVSRQFTPSVAGHIHNDDKTGKPFPRGLNGSGLRATAKGRHEIWLESQRWTAPKNIVISSQFWIFPKKMSYWLNDQYGDCVTAQQAFARACSGIWITNDTVMSWATKNGTLNGADLPPVASLMAKSGFSQDSNIYGCGPQDLAVDYTDVNTLCAAIFTSGQSGGCIQAGIDGNQLPSSAGNVNGWFLTVNQKTQDEDHCIAYCGYGTSIQFVSAMNTAFPDLNLKLPANVSTTNIGIATYTWSTIGWSDYKCVSNMTGEAWMQSPPTAVIGSGQRQTVDVYTYQPTPPPVPPTPTPTPTPPTPQSGNTMTITINGTTSTYELSPVGTSSALLEIKNAVNKLP
jgi:hypothetical protein